LTRFIRDSNREQITNYNIARGDGSLDTRITDLSGDKQRKKRAN